MDGQETRMLILEAALIRPSASEWLDTKTLDDEAVFEMAEKIAGTVDADDLAELTSLVVVGLQIGWEMAEIAARKESG